MELLSMTIANLMLLLYCTYLFGKSIFEEKGWKKAKALIWIVAMRVILLSYEVGELNMEMTEMDLLVVIIGIVILAVYSIIYNSRGEELWRKLLIFVGWLSGIFLFAIVSCLQSIQLFYFFKLMTMLVLIIGIFAFNGCSDAIRITGVIVIYFLTIMLNVVLTQNFMFSSVEEVWKTVYEVLQRMYSLPQLEEEVEIMEIFIYIIDFFVCRVMDTMLLGVLSGIFVNMGNRNYVRKVYGRQVDDTGK